MSTAPNPEWPSSIREINDLPREAKRAIYATLIPEWVFPLFNIHREDFTIQGEPAIDLRCPSGSNSVEISVFAAPDAADPALYLQMGDTFNSQLLVLLVIVNDPQSPRFDIDVDEQGRDTQLGTLYRNIPEETRALKAGLAPGQIRRGLRIFRTAVPLFDGFVARMGHPLFFIEPLFYHNAITFERYGFAYSQGFKKMMWIHQEFQPGGELHRRLDNSTPFRRPDAWRSILGRSWAIHDGIMNEPFTGVQMYKRVHQDSHIRTFPNAKWTV